MKELSTEQKAKLYDEAVERAKEIINNQNASSVWKGWLCNCFPELTESKDERIRKNCIHFLELQKTHHAATFEIEECIAWLEKQKEFVSADFDDVWKTADCDELTAPLEKYSKDAIKKMCHAWYDKGIELERKSWLEKQYEQKPQGKSALEAVQEEKVDNQNCVNPTDKAEPKFHKGQWVVWQDKCYKVNYNGCGYELVDQNGLSILLDYGTIDENARLWVIQDAKDGDLIYVSTEEKGIQAIFDKFDNGIIYFHCSLCSDFTQGGYMPIGDVEMVYPLQKTHYQRFFQKMKEAGYKWNDKKKELKRVKKNDCEPDALIEESYQQQADDLIDIVTEKSAWSEEDEKMVLGIEQVMQCASLLNIVPDKIEKVRDWLKSLKERVQPQPKQEWSEEDETTRNALINLVEMYYSSCINKSEKNRLLSWLNELKESKL